MTKALPLGAALAAAMLLASSVPAFAQEASDARCFVASNLFVKAGDEKSKEAAARAGFFYLGRLRGTPSQVEAAIAAQARTLNAQNASTVMQQCARAVEAKMQELQAIGQRLQSRENSAPKGR